MTDCREATDYIITFLSVLLSGIQKTGASICRYMPSKPHVVFTFTVAVQPPTYSLPLTSPRLPIHRGIYEGLTHIAKPITHFQLPQNTS